MYLGGCSYGSKVKMGKIITNQDMFEEVISFAKQYSPDFSTAFESLYYSNKSRHRHDMEYNYERSVAEVRPGAEGVIIDFYVISRVSNSVGDREEKYKQIPLGILKTLDDSDEDYAKMGLISGLLTCYAERYMFINDGRFSNK